MKHENLITQTENLINALDYTIAENGLHYADYQLTSNIYNLSRDLYSLFDSEPDKALFCVNLSECAYQWAMYGDNACVSVALDDLYNALICM